MPVVVPVKFPYASRDLWFDPCGLDIVQADYAICTTERGTEIGLVTADPFEVPASELSAPLKYVIRVASDEDLDRADDLACAGEDAMEDFRRLVAKNGLDMKPVGVEFLFGGEKAVFYFAAEDRVDFRQLVKDLSARFHVRVDMRQIGVRDETRLVGGYAHCGQELCCTRFGGQFEPVSIRMAKEQDLPLNSSKISGMCGRLMCCLRYEFEAYKDFKGRAPKKKTLIDTPLGRARIQEYDTPREQLILRLESGKVFRVNLADMTCSDACVKRSREQGCACRPDTVTRDILDRIESPEIKLALMELDREHGVDVGDGLDTSDRIIASGPTPRRRRMREEEATKFHGTSPESRGGRRRPSDNEGAADEASQSRRRRRRSASEGAEGTRPAKDAAQEKRAAGEQGPGGRRRRRHLSAEERDDAFRNAAAREDSREAKRSGDAAPGRSRRRHTTSPDVRPGRSVKPDVPSVADQLADGDVKVSRRRRPGDGGGAKQAPERDRRAPQGEQDAPGAEKKRRRRRRRKPGSGEGGSAPSAPGGGEA